MLSTEIYSNEEIDSKIGRKLTKRWPSHKAKLVKAGKFAKEQLVVEESGSSVKVEEKNNLSGCKMKWCTAMRSWIKVQLCVECNNLVWILEFYEN